MTASAGSEGKLQTLIERFGGWTFGALCAVMIFTYQSDKAATQQTIAGLEKNIATNQRAISRLQEGKVSREEFKSVQEQWIRETIGLREDIREGLKTLRSDLAQRDREKAK